MSKMTFTVEVIPPLPGNTIRDFWVNLDDGEKYCPFYVQEAVGVVMTSDDIRATGMHELFTAIADETVKRREAEKCVEVADGA